MSSSKYVVSTSDDLKSDKAFREKVAKELNYPESVITKIRNAQSTAELDRVMIDARKNL